MRHPLSSGRFWHVRPVTIRSASAFLLGAVALLIGVWLSGETGLYAQSRTATGSLVLQVRPEEFLERRAGDVLLKIRLAGGTTARVWAANTCTSPSPESQVIGASGTYTLPLDPLILASGHTATGAAQVCLLSSDGLLRDARPLEGAGDGYAGVKAVLPGMPAALVVTTDSGTATWSRP